MKYFCCDHRRRQGVSEHGTLNGIDYLEVLDSPSMPAGSRQRIFHVYFLKDLTPATVPDIENVRIDGGERITGIEVTQADVDLVSAPKRLVVTVGEAGDFSIYTLSLVDDQGAPLGFLDPLLSRVDFSFKAGCPASVDCRDAGEVAPRRAAEPVIDYLAKDYESFRRLMLDRLAVLLPEWRETSPADLGVTLIELLAYVGDRLSYRQDAVATEAYLETAHRRPSIRRHARLVDYPMHDGSNARVWARVGTDATMVVLPAKTQVLTKVDGLSERLTPGSEELAYAIEQGAEVFETMHEIVLHQDHDSMDFYTWGSRECCLPRGATKATLSSSYADLRAGDVLIFEEVKGSTTGEPGDADPARRQAIRLTHVRVIDDPAGGRFLSPPNDNPVPVTEIEWGPADALTRSFCVSALDSDGELIDGVSVARGNVVLADHGRQVDGRELGTVPPADPVLDRKAPSGSHCSKSAPRKTPPRFRPALPDAPVTRAEPLTIKSVASLPFVSGMATDLDGGVLPAAVADLLAGRGTWLATSTLSIQGSAGAWSASDGLRAFTLRRRTVGSDDLLQIAELGPPAGRCLPADRDEAEAAARRALPSIRLADGDGDPWTPARDLLSSASTSREFVVETGSDGTAYLRFGDDRFGRRPNSGTSFIAAYRIGNGSTGKIGAGTLCHVVSTDSAVTGVENPLPARGGVDPESLEEVRQAAPFAFLRQERAVNPDDYATMARRHPEVQNAAATLRWTGSWHTVFLTVDRVGGREVDRRFENDLRRFLDVFRMVGHDLEIDSPRTVALEIALEVCVDAGHDPSRIEREIRRRLGSRDHADGTRGLFHPDNLTFGQPVYLSEIYALAQEVEGVATVRVTTFRRQDDASSDPLQRGMIDLGRLEVARLDNDPSFPGRGTLEVRVESGP
jgi:predicted phage baseplate assembly protein